MEICDNYKRLAKKLIPLVSLVKYLIPLIWFVGNMYVYYPSYDLILVIFLLISSISVLLIAHNADEPDHYGPSGVKESELDRMSDQYWRPHYPEKCSICLNRFNSWSRVTEL